MLLIRFHITFGTKKQILQFLPAASQSLLDSKYHILSKIYIFPQDSMRVIQTKQIPEFTQ